MKMSDLTDKYICDNGHEFCGKDAELQLMCNNFSAPFAQFAFVDCEGTMMRGVPKSEVGDSVLACPVCHEVHPGGFDSAAG